MLFAGASLPIREIGLLVAVALAAFVLACPAVVLNPMAWWKDFAFELRKSSEGMGVLFQDTGSGWVYHLVSSLRFGMGVPMLLLVVGGLSFAVFRRSRSDAYLLTFTLIYYVVIGAAQVRFMRYVIPLLPPLALFVGRLLAGPQAPNSGDGIGATRRSARVGGGEIWICALGAAAGAATLFLTLALDRLMTVPDARDRAYDYIHSNIPTGTVIGFVRTPWYDVPPLAPEFTAPSPGLRREAALSLPKYTVRLPAPEKELDSDVLSPPLPGVVITSDLATEDWERLRLPAWREFKRVLETNYAAHVFENTPSIFGLDLGKPAYVPNDLLYIYPRVTVYTLR